MSLMPPPGLPAGPSTGPEALSRALQVCPDLAPEVRQLLAATNPANVTERGLYMHDFDSMGQVRGPGRQCCWAVR